MRFRRPFAAVSLAAIAALSLAACGSSQEPASDSGEPASAEGYPIVVAHAFGETEIPAKPERVATVNWANQEVPLALGVVPVGMAAANFGDDDNNGILPWVEEKLEELGGEQPVLFDETDGIDFEAVADTDPDVILAAYSGLTEEDYKTLSEIAPVVAYPEVAWGTSWRDMISFNSKGMGMAEEGDALIAELDKKIETSVAEHPELEDKGVMFVTHVDAKDLSIINFYTDADTRVEFFHDLGMKTPKSVQEASAGGSTFSGSISAEEASVFDDVDVIVTYGDQELVDILKADELYSQIPAVKNDAIVFLDGSGPMGTASNPTPLSIDWVLDDYLDQLSEAAFKSE